MQDNNTFCETSLEPARNIFEISHPTSTGSLPPDRLHTPIVYKGKENIQTNAHTFLWEFRCFLQLTTKRHKRYDNVQSYILGDN